MLQFTEKDTTPDTVVTVFNLKDIKYESLIFGDSDKIKLISGLSDKEVKDLLWYGTVTNGDLTYTTFRWRHKSQIVNYKGETYTIETIKIPIFGKSDEVMIGLYDVNGYWSESIEITKLNEKINNGSFSLVDVVIIDDLPDVLPTPENTFISHLCSKSNKECVVVESHALGQKFLYCRTHRKEVLP